MMSLPENGLRKPNSFQIILKKKLIFGINLTHKHFYH